MPHRIWRIILGFGLLSGILACSQTPRVTIEGPEGTKGSFEVEVADTPAKRSLGLMYRTDLRVDQGMLFIFPEESVQVFWMKNTPLPLDMIFIDRNRKIVGIVRETQPFSTQGRSVARPSQYVLEVRGGLADQMGLEVGDRVSFQSFDGLEDSPERERKP